MKKILDKSGYSLIELIIVLALVGLVSVPLMLSFTTGLKLYERETASNESVQSLREFYITLNEEMRSMSIGQVIINGSDLTIGSKTYSLVNNSIVSITVGDTSTVTELSNVDSMTISDVVNENGRVRSFNISITIEDYEGTFTLDTNYTLRGE